MLDDIVRLVKKSRLKKIVHGNYYYRLQHIREDQTDS
jgi:hypothetical protein